MSTKNTQGEWCVSKHGNNDSFGVYAEGNENDLAIVKGGNEEGGETEANAKLIAAAPDLLDIVLKIKEDIDTGKIDAKNGIAIDSITWHFLNSVINKATI